MPTETLVEHLRDCWGCRNRGVCEDAEQLAAELEAQLAKKDAALLATATKLHYTVEHLLAFEDCYAADCIDARAALEEGK